MEGALRRKEVRFFISSNIKSNTPLYITVVLFLISSFVYWTINWFFYAAKFGITYTKMFTYFFTDPSFPEKMPLAQLLEDVHIQFFLYTTFLLVLSSLFLHKCVRETLKYTLVALSFLSAAGELLSSFAVYFLGPAFIHLKILMFFSFQIFTGTMLFLTLKLYITREKEEPPERSLLYSLVFVFALSTVLFAALNFFLFTAKLGLTPESIANYYTGNPEKFIRPKSLKGIIEVVSPHTVSMGIYLFALVHFVFFTNVRRKVLLSLITTSSGLLNNFSPLLIRFVSTDFSYLKLFSFLLLTISMIYISTLIAISVIRHRAKAVLLV